MGKKKNSLISGVAILSVAGILSKIIGMFFRIPLTNIIGSSGLGVYQAAYPTYTLLLTLSTAGIPVAISRLVSENITMGRKRQAKAVLRTALVLLTATGTALSLLLIAFSRPFAVLTGDAAADIGFIAIAPSIMLVSILSAFRGYMQGHGNMAPTAISQLIEQIAKVTISFPLAYAGMKTGFAQAAAGALWGITIGEALALLYIAIVYFSKKKGFLDKEEKEEPELAQVASFGTLARQMVTIAVPITVGSMIVPLAGFIDAAMIRLRLMAAGQTEEAARSLYGLLSGSAISIINVPTVLATAVCIGVVPIISAARVEGRTEDMHETGRMGLRLGSLIGFPCAIGMSMLATPIINLLFHLPAEEIAITGEILSLSALTIIFFTHVQTTTGILQGAGMQKIPMYSLVLGVAVKIALNYILIAIPSIYVFGAPIASLACYIISMAVNMAWIVRKVGMKMDWGGIVFRPGAATVGMAVVVLIAMQVLDMNSRLNTLLAVAAGIVVYVALVFVFGALRREDMAQIPGGAKLEKLMIKIRVWH